MTRRNISGSPIRFEGLLAAMKPPPTVTTKPTVAIRTARPVPCSPGCGLVVRAFSTAAAMTTEAIARSVTTSRIDAIGCVDPPLRYQVFSALSIPPGKGTARVHGCHRLSGGLPVSTHGWRHKFDPCADDNASASA